MTASFKMKQNEREWWNVELKAKNKVELSENEKRKKEKSGLPSNE